MIGSPRTFLALRQEQCFVYNSGLDLKRKSKKKSTFKNTSELQKWKKIEKARFENILKFLYLFKI